MEECGIVDATAFACSMDSSLCCKVSDDTAVLFSTPQEAYKFVYKQYTQEQKRLSARYVKEFYADCNLQAACVSNSLILRGVATLYDRRNSTYEPISMEYASQLLRGNREDDFSYVMGCTKEEIEGEFDRWD